MQQDGAVSLKYLLQIRAGRRLVHRHDADGCPTKGASAVIKVLENLGVGRESILDEAEPEVLDTWFQFADESVYLKLACPVIDPSKDTAVDDVLALAQGAHECLMKAYQEITADCDMQRVCDVFQSLLDEGQREWKALMRNTQLLSDL